jgi:hypothetical protein
VFCNTSVIKDTHFKSIPVCATPILYRLILWSVTKDVELYQGKIKGVINRTWRGSESKRCVVELSSCNSDLFSVLRKRFTESRDDETAFFQNGILIIGVSYILLFEIKKRWTEWWASLHSKESTRMSELAGFVNRKSLLKSEQREL